MTTKDELLHYASPYYDPVKAHEYYMRHRQLKGKARPSTSGLNETGKNAASYVKSQIQAEHVKKVNLSKKAMTDKINAETANAKQEIETHKATMEKGLEALRDRMKHMTKLQRLAHKGEFKQEIERLRSENEKARAKIMERLSQVTAKAKSEHAASVAKSQANAEATYDKEVEKMNREASFRKPVKTKSSTGTGSKKKKGKEKTTYPFLTYTRKKPYSINKK